MSALQAELRAAAASLDRRTFLRLAGVAAATGIMPSGCGGVPEGLAPRPDVTLAVLSPRTYAVFTAAAMRIVGPRGAELIADRRVDVGGLADAWLVAAPSVAGPLGQALLVLEFGVWPVIGKVRPFTSVPPGAQDGVLAECMTSRLDLKRSLFRGVRSLALLTFYGSPATRSLTGYPGPFGTGSVTIADAMKD